VLSLPNYFDLTIANLYLDFFYNSSDASNIHDGSGDTIRKSILHPGCVGKSRNTGLPSFSDKIAFFEENCKKNCLLNLHQARTVLVQVNNYNYKSKL